MKIIAVNAASRTLARNGSIGSTSKASSRLSASRRQAWGLAILEWKYEAVTWMVVAIT